MNDKLLLTPLENALETLLEAINIYQSESSNTLVRDGLIQRFEFCYDLSTKFLKRHLSHIADDPNATHEMSFQEIIRDGYTKGLLKNSWDTWHSYREGRNITSHSYDEKKALSVVGIIPDFYSEAYYFLTKLQQFYKTPL